MKKIVTTRLLDCLARDGVTREELFATESAFVREGWACKNSAEEGRERGASRCEDVKVHSRAQKARAKGVAKEERRSRSLTLDYQG